jgi:CheY-like chemotaxis protein
MGFKFCWEDLNCSKPCQVRDNGTVFCWRSKPSRDTDGLHLCETCNYRLRWVQGEYSVEDFIARSDRRSTPRENPRVLVIDDEPSILFAFEETVGHLGYDCISARDGEEGLVLVKGVRPDLIITDLVLPRLDGIDLFRRLRQDPGTRHIPVIVVTARNSMGDRELCRDLGAEALLIKPFSAHDLTHHIEQALDGLPKQAGSA